MRLFFSTECVDAWQLQQRATLVDDQMVLSDGKAYRLSPAVHVLRVAGDGPDPNELVGKVKTEVQLRELSAEHYMDSLLLRDVGYEVKQGYVGELVEP